MHPATSIILFTVCSGAGFGLLAALGFSAAWGQAPQGAVFWLGFILAFALSVGGLLSSTFHLGHPERALRAFSQWRSSWLSREGVMAVVTLAVAGLYALTILAGQGAAAWLGPISAILALITVFTTSMIYAQLKTVQRWHTPLTPLAFITFSMGSGAIFMGALTALFSDQGAQFWPLAAAVFLFIGWSARQRAWRAGDARDMISTPETATGLGHMGSVRLFEAPHTGQNYLLREMGFTVARRHAHKLRFFALLLGAMVPMLTTLAASGGFIPAFMLILGAATLMAGLFIERWLFFAEARHAVTAFYDRTPH